MSDKTKKANETAIRKASRELVAANYGCPHDHHDYENGYCEKNGHKCSPEKRAECWEWYFQKSAELLDDETMYKVLDAINYCAVVSRGKKNIYDEYYFKGVSDQWNIVNDAICNLDQPKDKRKSNMQLAQKYFQDCENDNWKPKNDIPDGWDVVKEIKEYIESGQAYMDADCCASGELPAVQELIDKRLEEYKKAVEN